MTSDEESVVRGHCDRADRLVHADEPLARLQGACGGAIPGTLAIPELLELVRLARLRECPLAQTVRAEDERQAVTFWAEARPGDGGCRLVLADWRVFPLPSFAGQGEPDPALTALLADVYLRLDAEQRVQAVVGWDDACQPLCQTIEAGLGRQWTELVRLEGREAGVELPWRLMASASAVAASGDPAAHQRRWRVQLTPCFGAGRSLLGFDLHLLPSLIEDIAGDRRYVAQASPACLLGRDRSAALRRAATAILAEAEKLGEGRDRDLAPCYATYADDIAAAGRHLLDLVGDLAAQGPASVASLDVGGAVDLAALARRAAALLQGRAREREITVRATPDGLTLVALGDPRRAYQVVLNLLDNALRYAPRASTVCLEGERLGSHAVLAVIDEGPSLSPADQARAFDKFERLGRGEGSGSGLGLYISRRLARSMGGELTVGSGPRGGNRFALELPAV